MADYYPLIARAIAGLDPSAPGESRRALYERARAALIQQLRSVDPPLSESEITRERLSLEEAVRKVESEAAQRAREASRGGAGSSARDSFRRANAQPGGAPAAAARPRPGAAPTVRDPRPPSAPDGGAQRNAPPPIPLSIAATAADSPGRPPPPAAGFSDYVRTSPPTTPSRATDAACRAQLRLRAGGPRQLPPIVEGRRPTRAPRQLSLDFATHSPTTSGHRHLSLDRTPIVSSS